MIETKAVELLAKWDEINTPQDCDDLIFWLSSWIAEKESDLTEADGVVAQRKLVLIESLDSVAKAQAYLEVEPCFKNLRAMEANLRELKSARANVKRRYEILVNKVLQNRRF